MREALNLIVPVFAAGLTLTACLNVPTTADSKEVRERYPHRVEDRCHSWLYSATTGHPYCASPAFVAEAPVDLLAAAPAKAQPAADGQVELGALQKAGEGVYRRVCVACHQPDGKGLPGTFPPLAGAGEYYGDPKNMAKIIVHGLNGEIEVLGTKYNGAMPPQAALSDYEVAAVATYVRTNFGNNDGMVTPDDVKAIR